MKDLPGGKSSFTAARRVKQALNQSSLLFRRIHRLNLQSKHNGGRGGGNSASSIKLVNKTVPAEPPPAPQGSQTATIAFRTSFCVCSASPRSQ